jgi:hypothetical protein
MGTVDQRKGTQFYWIKYAVEGETRYESSKSPIREDAEKLLKIREGDVARGKTLPPVTLTVNDLLDAALLAQKQKGNKSIDTSAYYAAHLRPVFGRLKAGEMTAAHIRQYREKCLSQDDKPSTVNRRVSFLKYAFALAAREGRIGQMPPFPPSLPERNVRQGFVEPADFMRFIDTLPDDGVDDFVEWLGWTGMRVGQARLLDKSMLQGEDELRMPGRITKSGEDEVLPLFGPLKRVIDRRRAALAADPTKTRIFWRDGKERVGQFRHPWRKALKASGLPSTLTVHDLRRTAARNLRRAGLTEEECTCGREGRHGFDNPQGAARLMIAATETTASSARDSLPPPVINKNRERPRSDMAWR